MRTFILILLLGCNSIVFAQDDLLALVSKPEDVKKEYVSNAFKSSRVVNGHSMEFIGKRVINV